MTNPMLRWLGRAAPPVTPAKAARRRETFCYLGDHRALTVTHRGHKIFLDTRDIGLTPHIALDGVWEREVEILLGRLLRPGARVVEIGANMGYHTLAMAEAIGAEGHIHAFEANPAVLPLLRATIAVNGFSERVCVHPEAALDTAGTVEFTSDPEHIGSGHLALIGESANYSRRVAVPAVTLDAALANEGPFDLLRMDAEGTEPQILRGAAMLLQNSPGLVIVTEWAAPMMAARGDLGAFVGWLAGMGFGFWRIDAEARLEPVAAEALPQLPHAELVISRTTPA